MILALRERERGRGRGRGKGEGGGEGEGEREGSPSGCSHPALLPTEAKWLCERHTITQIWGSSSDSELLETAKREEIAIRGRSVEDSRVSTEAPEGLNTHGSKVSREAQGCPTLSSQCSLRHP